MDKATGVAIMIPQKSIKTPDLYDHFISPGKFFAVLSVLMANRSFRLLYLIKPFIGCNFNNEGLKCTGGNNEYIGDVIKNNKGKNTTANHGDDGFG